MYASIALLQGKPNGTAAEVFDYYTDLYNRATERGRRRIYEADKAVGLTYAFHLAHNWGNAESKRELRRSNKLTSYICRRKDREFALAEHRDHVRRGDVGRYLWCKGCQSGA
jgi:hypothetical protein